MTSWDLRSSPSNLPRIGADNAFRRGVITASAGTGRYAVDWRADRVWAPGDGTQTLSVVLDAPAAVDYVFIAFHNFSTTATSIAIQRWTGSAWAPVLTLPAPEDDGPIWRSFDADAADQWRIVLTTPAAGEGDPQPALAILSLGQALELAEGIQPGWSPPVFGGSGDVVDSVSEDGLLIARTLHRRPDETTLELAPLDDAWMRAHWRPVRDRLIRQSWAICWSPQTDDQGAAWAWTDGMPPADRYRETGLMRVSWPLRMLERRDVSAADTVQEAQPDPDIPVIIASIAVASTLYYGEAVAITEPSMILVDDFPI